jgi:hypothetical protein
LANMKSGWGASSGGSAKSSSSAKSPTEKLMAMHQAREQQSKK